MYVRQEQQQAATDKAADKPRSRASGEQEEAASWPEATDLAPQRTFVRKQRERSASEATPTARLLLVCYSWLSAWRKTALRRSKGASIACVRTMSSPGNRKPRQGHENRCPTARNHSGATQNKARARGEPSLGPPASETDARPLGHQPRGGAPPRPRPTRGQRPRPRKRASLALQILAPNLDLSSEADSEARKTHAELKNKLQEAPVLGAAVRPFWL